MVQLYQDEIKRLTSNIGLLKERFKNQKDQNLNLQQENIGLKKELNNKELLIEELEYKYKTLLNARNLEGGTEGKDQTKATINHLVREIDKCLALLND